MFTASFIPQASEKRRTAHASPSLPPAGLAHTRRRRPRAIAHEAARGFEEHRGLLAGHVEAHLVFAGSASGLRVRRLEPARPGSDLSFGQADTALERGLRRGRSLVRRQRAYD